MQLFAVDGFFQEKREDKLCTELQLRLFAHRGHIRPVSPQNWQIGKLRNLAN